METFIGGVGSEKALVVIAAEEGGRVRLIHAPGNHAKALKVVFEREIGEETTVKTDGHAGYNATSLGDREHDAKIQNKAKRQQDDHLQLLHWTASNVKRWLIGTHHGGVKDRIIKNYEEKTNS